MVDHNTQSQHVSLEALPQQPYKNSPVPAEA